jgi:hypothetical protein
VNPRLAACVLALFALGWLLDRAHLALEPHHFCAEHGRVEHASGFPAPVADVHTAAAQSGPALESAPESSHESCCVTLARGEEPVALVHPPLDAFPWLLSDGGVVPERANDVARSAVPLVLLAPKQSPPRG